MRERIENVERLFNNLVQDFEELEGLTKRVKTVDPKFVLEIGTERGGTAYWWMTEFHAYVVSIDISDHNLIDQPFKDYHGKGEMHFIKGNSHSDETMEYLAEIMMWMSSDYFDFLFIDGDHSYKGVKEDYEIYKTCVRDGGLIGFHDIYSDQVGDGGVKKFWDELEKPEEHWIFHRSIGTGLIRRVA